MRHRKSAELLRTATVLFVSLVTMTAAFAAGPFEHMAGSWSGSGTVTFASGAEEPIRCEAQYRTGQGGDAVRQDLECASPSYTLEMEADLVHSAGEISGTWSELTNDATGDVSGTVNDGEIRASIRGATFSANVGVNTRGDSQAVVFRPGSSDVDRVSIDLRRD